MSQTSNSVIAENMQVTLLGKPFENGRFVMISRTDSKSADQTRYGCRSPFWAGGMIKKRLKRLRNRFLICLTKGEPRIRWLAAQTSVWLGRRCMAIDLEMDPGSRVRQVMLRTQDCCDSCALEQTTAVPGNHYWILIL